MQNDVKAVLLTADTDAADADGVCTSQTPAGGGSQTLTIDGAKADGGVATFTAARFVTVTSVADESGRTFTITGTDVHGDAQTESITGVNAGLATGTKYFRTVTEVAVDDDTTGAVTVGMANNSLEAISKNSTRISGVNVVCSATAGALNFADESSTGTVRLVVGTVASATVIQDMSVPGTGVFFKNGVYLPYTAGTTVFTQATVFYA